MKQNRFTQEEIQYLMQHYEDKGPKLIGEALDRPMKAVSKKARSLGLSRGVAAGNLARTNVWQFTEWSYDLGYIVGVYLGDGNIFIKPKQTAYFRLSVIDRDFCLAVQEKLKRLTGLQGSVKFSKSRQQWIYCLCNRDFVYWLRDNFGGPGNKCIKLLPDIDANQGMIEGIVDSEGTVTSSRIDIRMAGDLHVLDTICKQLSVQHHKQHCGVRQQNWQNTPGFFWLFYRY